MNNLLIRKAVIEVFGACNYECKMCPQSPDLGGREKSFKRALPFDTFTNILDQLKDTDIEEIYLEGSGEPTMNKRLPEYIEYGSKLGFKMSFITNGTGFTTDKIKDIVDAGLYTARISVIGYNQEKYKEWMSEDNFYQIIDNTNAILGYIKQSNSKVLVGTYHLILDHSNQDYEVEQYRKNFIDLVPGVQAGIWRMHNWAGKLSSVNWRKGDKRSCGRPLSPDLIVRAGGNNGEHAAVVPCCEVLGQDSKAVVGHLSNQTIEEVWNGAAYEKLREQHRKHEFDDIDYCKNCDMLYETPDALVWDNYHASYHTLTGALFDMRDYRI